MIRKIGAPIALLIFFTATCSSQAQQPQAARTPFGNVQKPFPPGTNISEDAAPSNYYRLDFTIKELDREKLVDTRNYSLSVQSGIAENMVAGSEVPYPSGSYATAGSVPVKNISYRNIGVSIMALMKETEDSPKLDLKLEVSDVLPPEKGADAPAFRKIQFGCMALLPLGKSTTVGVVEDPGSRHRFQVDVIATKIK
jgi:hypothetical protein